MQALAGCTDYVELLEEVPSLSNCTRDVLADFVAHSAIKAHCDAGKVLCGLEQDHNLYVLTSGSAALHVGPDIVVHLEPGDYFGQESGRHHKLGGTVVAVTDVEAIIVGPQDIAQLEYASCRDRHPSRIGWKLERSTPTQRRRRTHRRNVMVTLGV
jgi:CRP-like cAMP-binding protein